MVGAFASMEPGLAALNSQNIVRPPVLPWFSFVLGAAPLVAAPGIRFNLANWSPLQQAWLVLGAGLLLVWTGLRFRGKVSGPTPDALPLLLLVGITCLFLASTLAGPIKIMAVPQWANWLILASCCWLTLTLAGDDQGFRRLWVFPAIGLALVALVGLIQKAGVTLPLGQGVPPGSTLGNKNIAAELIAAGLPLSVYFALGRKGAWRVILFVLLGLELGFILLAQALTALLAVLTSALAIWSIRKIPDRFWAALGAWVFVLALGFTVLLFLPDSPGPAKGSPTDPGASLLATKTHNAKERLLLWQKAWGLWLDKPILGHGPGSFNRALAEIIDPDGSKVEAGLFTFRRQPQRAHNGFLTYMAEAGLAGLMLAALFALALVRLVRKGGQGPAPWILGSLAGWLVILSLSVGVAVPSMMAFLGATLGLGFSLGREAEKPAAGKALSSAQAAVGVAMIVLAAGLLGPQLAADFHFSRAIDQLKQGAPKASQINLAKAGELNLWDPNIPLFRGGRYHSRNRLDEAAAQYELVLALAPHHPSALHNLALVAWERNDLDRALALAQRAAWVAPSEIEPLRLIWRIRKKRGDLPGAFRSLQRLIDLHPADYEARYQLGRLYFDQKDYLQAREALNRAGQVCGECSRKNAIASLADRTESLLGKEGNR